MLTTRIARETIDALNKRRFSPAEQLQAIASIFMQSVNLIADPMQRDEAIAFYDSADYQAHAMSEDLQEIAARLMAGE